MYEPPKSELYEKKKGIDGKTCPACMSKISLKRYYLKSYMPNHYLCDGCNTVLKHQLPRYFTLLFMVFILVVCLASFYFIRTVFGISGRSSYIYYFMYVLPTTIALALGVQSYLRVKGVLVEKYT